MSLSTFISTFMSDLSLTMSIIYAVLYAKMAATAYAYFLYIFIYYTALSVTTAGSFAGQNYLDQIAGLPLPYRLLWLFLYPVLAPWVLIYSVAFNRRKI